MIAHERRSTEDRRKMITTPVFPFFDSEDTLVRQDRRQIPERRINNNQFNGPHNDLTPIEEGESGNNRLFIWFQEQIHEVKCSGEGVWLGRADDCITQYSSRFVSRKHSRLYFHNNAYYLVDDSVNGTYIQNDDGEFFITKDKVEIKGSGVISLGIPFDHSDSDVIHYFIG